ncbi:MAG TPA: MFS transporter [Candidatus Saccharimonadales bacterium]|nr:MFS transporter [Candidatus Saccharimonadales bacterium]
MTEEQKWLSRKYLLYRMFSNMWFFGTVWLYFYRLFITDQQVGLLDGMAFAIGLIAEVPSGALADKFGRDKMVRLGQLFIAGGILVQALNSSFTPFFVGQAIMMIGFSFTSGADDALFFEKLGFKRDSTLWRKLVTRGSQAALTATLIATVIGGWLHTINPRVPWILTSLAFIVATVLIWPVKDTRPKDTRGKLADEIKSYLQDVKIGFAQFRLPKLRPYVPIIITVQGLFYVAGYGLLRIVLLDRFTFSPFAGAIAVAICGVITVGILHFTHKYADRLSEKRTFTLISLSAAAGLLLSLANIGLWGFVVILTLYAGEYVMYAFMSEVLNNHALEKHRATVLSVASFLRMLPYVCLAPIIGLLNTNDQLQYFLIIWASLICGATALYVLAKRSDTKIKVEGSTKTEPVI